MYVIIMEVRCLEDPVQLELVNAKKEGDFLYAYVRRLDAPITQGLVTAWRSLDDIVEVNKQDTHTAFVAIRYAVLMNGIYDVAVAAINKLDFK
jgi:hypothetical protein